MGTELNQQQLLLEIPMTERCKKVLKKDKKNIVCGLIYLKGVLYFIGTYGDYELTL